MTEPPNEGKTSNQINTDALQTVMIEEFSLT